MDFIPLNSQNQNRKRSYNSMNDGNPKKRGDSPSQYINEDNNLRMRIEELVGRNKLLKYNADRVVEMLQAKFPEYRRKKKNILNMSVIKVISKLNKEEKGANSKDSDFSDGNDNYVTYQDTNMVNKSVSDLYMKTPNKQAGSLNPSDLVTPRPPKRDVSALNDQVSSNSNKIQKSSGSEEPRKGKKKKEITPQISSVTFSDLGGIENTLQEVCKLLVHMKHPEIYQQLGLSPPRGFLLHGPPGSGKTKLAHAIAGELGLPFIKTAATEVVSGVSGESEEKIRELFEKAVGSAPCILFIDEIDAITPKRETAQKEMERRIVAQLLTCLDDLSSKDVTTQVLVIGATNRPDSLDPALRRAGRFDREIVLGIPDEAARKRILQVLCKDLKLDSNFNFDLLAHSTPGFVGADLMSLTREAALCAINRVFTHLEKEKIADIPHTDSDGDKLQQMLSWLREQSPLNEEQLKNLFLEMQDFELALKLVQPSAKREGFATVPNVTWNDVGALTSVREELELSILAPVKHREKFEALGLSTSSGILLCGPPGCGKTLTAKAVANESGINFISVKGPELLNMYVGESERAVRQCFQRARSSAPCVIFFDELDALCPKRNDSIEGGSSARVVNQMLTEMDGLEIRKQVFVLAATNRLDMIDPAMLRPGRLDKMLFVGLPEPSDREDILKTLTKNGTRPVLNSDVDLGALARDRRVDGFSGADLAALVREASIQALKETISHGQEECIVVAWRHFQMAFLKVRASVTAKDQLRYNKMKLSSATSADCNKGHDTDL